MNQLIVNNKVINQDIFKILTDIKSELTNGKLNEFRYSGNSIAVTCPSHAFGHEKRPSCFINVKDDDVDYGTFHCFTCGISGNFAKFVGECFDRSEQFGEHWLLSHYANDYVVKELNLEKIDLNKQPTQNFLDESILDKFESYHPYMTQRKLTDDVIKKFDIKYDPEMKMIVFPVRDRKGRLKFLTRRSVEGKDFLIDRGASKSDVYLLNECQDEKEVFVTESQINCLTLWGWGYKSIAMLGAGTTKEQMLELSRTGIRHFILCYDPDDAGRNGAKRFKQLIDKSKFVDELILPKGKDVNDLTKEEFEELLNGI